MKSFPAACCLLLLLAASVACFDMADIGNLTAGMNSIDWGKMNCPDLTQPLTQCMTQAMSYLPQIQNLGIDNSIMENPTPDSLAKLDPKILQTICPMGQNLLNCVTSVANQCSTMKQAMESNAEFKEGINQFKTICSGQTSTPTTKSTESMADIINFDYLPDIDYKNVTQVKGALQNFNWSSVGCESTGLSSKLGQCVDLANYYLPQVLSLETSSYSSYSMTSGGQMDIDKTLLNSVCPMAKKLLECLIQQTKACPSLHNRLISSSEYTLYRPFFDQICGNYQASTCGVKVSSKKFGLCGGFGDPHFRLFNGKFVSYQYNGAISILNNKYLQVSINTKSVSAFQDKNGTAIANITIKYEDECGKTTMEFSPDQFPSVSAYEKNSTFVIYDGNQVYFPRIYTKIFIKKVHGYLAFALTTPFNDAQGLCRDGINAPTLRLLEGTETTYAQCDSISDPDLKASCNYDIATTNDPEWSSASTTFVALNSTVQTETQQLAEYLVTSEQYTVFGTIRFFYLSSLLVLAIAALLLL